MVQTTIQQIRGVKDLLQDTVAVAVDVIEGIHQDIVCQLFALLEQIDAIAVPVQMAGRVERTLTGGVYQAIRMVNLIAGTLATQVLDRLEKPGDPPEP